VHQLAAKVAEVSIDQRSPDQRTSVAPRSSPPETHQHRQRSLGQSPLERRVFQGDGMVEETVFPQWLSVT